MPQVPFEFILLHINVRYGFRQGVLYHWRHQDYQNWEGGGGGGVKLAGQNKL